MNQRITWARLPAAVREGVENILGEVVAEAVSQPFGFSPGSADRVTLASGRRAFVKAVCADVNASTPDLHRREAAVTAVLPQGVAAPDFLGMYDDGTWVALVLADVAGRHPQEPWVEIDVLQVLDAVAEIGRSSCPPILTCRSIRTRSMMRLEGGKTANEAPSRHELLGSRELAAVD
ncbi:hypothetical protein NHF46_04815 [Arthrobacter alpinus]|nr:hypothetical protein [Arthrobacter alpinus]